MRVFADRAEFLGDSDFVDARVDELLDDGYIKMRAQEINPDEMSMDVGAAVASRAGSCRARPRAAVCRPRSLRPRART